MHSVTYVTLQKAVCFRRAGAVKVSRYYHYIGTEQCICLMFVKRAFKSRVLANTTLDGKLLQL